MFTHFCNDQLPGLISLVGSNQFLSGIMGATTRSVAQVDVCAMFSYDETHRPAGYATVSTSLEEVARKSAERYVSDLGVHDPIRQILQSGHAHNEPITFHLPIENIQHARYRDLNYVRTDTVERLSILCRDVSSWYSINFYRKKALGRFRPEERDTFVELAPILSSLVLKHVQIVGGSTACGVLAPLEHIRTKLWVRSPTLSQRECEVCALIVLGHTSEAIGLKLGVSSNTVLTYRKRAYAKLGIGSQNELFRICLDSV